MAEERAHALLTLLAHAQPGDDLGRGRTGGAEVHVRYLADHALAGGERLRAAGAQGVDQRGEEGVEVLGRNDAVDQAALQSFVRGETLPGEEILARIALAHPFQEVGRDARRYEPDLHLGEAEHGALRG